MDNSIFELMKRASIFVIVAQIIIHFRPNKTYEKYLKMLVGMMLVAVLFIPLTKLFSEEIGKTFEQELGRYEKKMETTLQEAGRQTETYESTYVGNIENEIKMKLDSKNIRKVTLKQDNTITIFMTDKITQERCLMLRREYAKKLGILEDSLEVIAGGMD